MTEQGIQNTSKTGLESIIIKTNTLTHTHLKKHTLLYVQKRDPTPSVHSTLKDIKQDQWLGLPSILIRLFGWERNYCRDRIPVLKNILGVGIFELFVAAFALYEMAKTAADLSLLYTTKS